MTTYDHQFVVDFGTWLAFQMYKMTLHAQELWDEIDEVQPADQTQAKIREYEMVCDLIDRLEAFPLSAYLDFRERYL